MGARALPGEAVHALSFGGEASIRAAVHADVDALAAVHARASRAAWAGLLPAEPLERLSSVERRRGQWRERLATTSRQSHSLVAEVGGQVAGLLAVGPTRDDDRDPTAVGEVAVLYVDPALWGRGIGRALLSEAVERLRRDGLASATLWTLATGARTRRFYELAGWRPEGTERPLHEGSGAFEVRYERTLGDHWQAP
ncbi:MAG: GNAT family N-acetyltransferase [Thermoleophilaceae bacterium]